MRRPFFRAVAAVLLLPCVVLPRVAGAEDPRVADAVETIEAHAKDPFGQRQREGAIRDLGRVGGAAAARALLPVFDDPFVHLRDRAVSAWIAMVKGERGAETVRWLSEEALEHRDLRVRRGAIVALGFDPRREARARLREVVRDAKRRRLRKEGEIDVLVEAARSLARLGGDAEDGLAALLAHPEGAVALAAAEALAAPSALPAPETIAALLASDDPLVRAAGSWLVVDAPSLLPERFFQAEPSDAPKIVLAERAARARVDDWIRPLLEDASWRVRAAAIRHVEATGDRAFVPLLIRRLEHEDGRLRLDALRALRKITRADVPPDATLWRAWWEANAEEAPPTAGAPFDPTEIPSAVGFFRLPVRSKRIAFLLDASGSMRDPSDPSDAQAETKWERAVRETSDTIRDLDADVQFDVFVYRYPSDYPPRPEMTRALGELATATSRARKRATRWMERQQPGGWGAFSDALDAILRTEADTIYFLSDGRPSRGTYDRDFRLLAELARANRFRQVVVHTVLVGRGGADRRFLESLAEETGGFFTDATVRSQDRN